MMNRLTVSAYRGVGIFLLLSVSASALPLAGAAHAAEWEWTKGKGWTEGAGRVRNSADAQFKYARSLEANGDYNDAAKQYFLLVQSYPNHLRAGLALQRLALCLYRMENYYETFKAVEQVLESYPNSAKRAELMAIEYTVGVKLMQGARVSILNEDPEANRRAGQLKAVEVFNVVLKRDRYGDYADDALLGLGTSYMNLGMMEKAIKAYQRLKGDFPNSPLIDRARVGETTARVRAGKASPEEVDRLRNQARAQRRSAKPGVPVSADQKSFSESVNKLEEIEAQKMWTRAKFYERRGTHDSVESYRFLLSEIIRRYPKTKSALMARGKLPKVVVPAKKNEGFSLDQISFVPKILRKKKSPKPAFEVAEPSGAVRSIPPDITVPGMVDYVGGADGGAAAIPANGHRALRVPVDAPTVPREEIVAPTPLVNNQMIEPIEPGIVAPPRPVERAPEPDAIVPPPIRNTGGRGDSRVWSDTTVKPNVVPPPVRTSSITPRPVRRPAVTRRSPELTTPVSAPVKKDDGWNLSPDFD